MTTLARRADVESTGRAQIIRAGFLARYRGQTREHYQSVIDEWYAWCYGNGIDPVDVKRAHVEVWLRYLEEQRGLMNSSICGKLTAVRGLYKYAHMDEYITANPTQFVQGPPVPSESRTEGLTRSEGYALMEAAKASCPQDHAIICILLLNGLRVGELCSLTIESITRDGGYVVLNFMREKNVKKARVPLMPRTSHAVDQILAGRTTGPLFLLRGEKPMDRRGVDRIIKRCSKAAGITKRMHPHVLRHSFITNGLKAGVGLRDMMNSVGHSSPRTTMHYDRDKDSLTRNAANYVAPWFEGSD